MNRIPKKPKATVKRPLSKRVGNLPPTPAFSFPGHVRDKYPSIAEAFDGQSNFNSAILQYLGRENTTAAQELVTIKEQVAAAEEAKAQEQSTASLFAQPVKNISIVSRAADEGGLQVTISWYVPQDADARDSVLFRGFPSGEESLSFEKVGNFKAGSLQVSLDPYYGNKLLHFEMSHLQWINGVTIVSAINRGTPTLIHPDEDPPANVTSLMAAYSSSRLTTTLSWVESGDDLDTAVIERKIGAGGAWAKLAGIPAGVQTFADQAAIGAGQTFYYRVYLKDKSGNVSPATWPQTTVSTSGIITDPVSVTAPVPFSISQDAATGETVVRWSTAGAVPAKIHFQVYETADWNNQITRIRTGSDTVPGQSYGELRVQTSWLGPTSARAWGVDANGNYSSEVGFGTVSLVALAAPTGIAVTPMPSGQKGALRIQWTHTGWHTWVQIHRSGEKDFINVEVNPYDALSNPINFVDFTNLPTGDYSYSLWHYGKYQNPQRWSSATNSGSTFHVDQGYDLTGEALTVGLTLSEGGILFDSADSDAYIRYGLSSLNAPSGVNKGFFLGKTGTGSSPIFGFVIGEEGKYIQYRSDTATLNVYGGQIVGGTITIGAGIDEFKVDSTKLTYGGANGLIVDAESFDGSSYVGLRLRADKGIQLIASPTNEQYIQGSVTDQAVASFLTDKTLKTALFLLLGNQAGLQITASGTTSVGISMATSGGAMKQVLGPRQTGWDLTALSAQDKAPDLESIYSDVSWSPTNNQIIVGALSAILTAMETHGLIGT